MLAVLLARLVKRCLVVSVLWTSGPTPVCVDCGIWELVGHADLLENPTVLHRISILIRLSGKLCAFKFEKHRSKAN